MQKLHQYGCHIVPPEGLNASLGNILIKEVLEHGLAILGRQLGLKLAHEGRRISFVPLPNAIAGHQHKLLLSSNVDLPDFREADDRLHMEGDFRH